MIYREYLFDDLTVRLVERPCRVLEIGPKDGLDTRRLLTLKPESLLLLDLPGRERVIVNSGETLVGYVAGDILDVEDRDPFDLIWCTGVLYHVKEQYRLIRRLYDWLVPGGILVLESATIRRRWLRNQRCVEILYPPDPRAKKKYHLSFNITHLPSQSAVLAWLQMAGFTRIERSDCHRRVSRALAKTRVAYIAERPRL